LKSTKRGLDAGASHTIFIYNQQTIHQVLHEYGALVFETLKQPELRKVVKAVGAVGKDNPDGLTIRHYWNEYDKAKSIKSFKAIKFIHILKKCYDTKSGNVSENYELLIQGVIDLLRKANKKTKNEENKDVFYNKTTLKKELKANSKYNQFRDLLTSWILNDFPDQNNWEKQRNKLQELMDLKNPLNQETVEFLAYDNQFSQNEGTQKSVTNRFQCNNGVNIEVGTIHSVKGETHDATLIMETKYHKNDISSMLDYFINNDLDAPTEKSRKAGFMRRLYVAASRPRHLLCLALNKEHITPDQIEALKAKGWCIKVINP
jgi:DNA helicase-2/ATP-dependent DNA helicase PcrA